MVEEGEPSWQVLTVEGFDELSLWVRQGTQVQRLGIQVF